eukprot:TRINITY_DN5552_c0_g1_i4.p4 TRINITY_DN5552_c0_g1~~TRINITY_DN5552_c0_g1_i4.p4  ORF type:complete len:155 (+),score=26.16 TRINITY_DN5552_c0_g1_i4:254-718(+)
MLVYSVCQRATFDAVVPVYLDSVRRRGKARACLMLVGTQCDREDAREVATAEGQALAQAHGLLFAECSARTGLGVRQAFDMLTTETLHRQFGLAPPWVLVAEGGLRALCVARAGADVRVSLRRLPAHVRAEVEALRPAEARQSSVVARLRALWS